MVSRPILPLLLACILRFLAVDAAAADDVDYLTHIKPILQARCYPCHGALKQESDLRLDTGRSMRGETQGYAVVTPGQPEQSLLLERVTSEEESLRMPPEGEPLTSEQISRLRKWIAQGAESPDDEQPEADPSAHWAFQSPIRPSVLPQPDATAANPIDAFISARLAEAGVEAAPPASRLTQLRRVTLDLIGLPPTPEEMRAFLADQSPQAYERVVDRLLHDPRHGERWARHWMDVWRYSDWFGRRGVPDVWNSAPQIWRWRDWIVRSLNADHGYDRMIREMLSADEVRPADPEAAVATGFLIRNWYALNPNDWMRANVEHTARAFLGLTFHCAHCHDHKYDPISQEDYFHLRAFFEPIGIRQDRVAGEGEPGPFQEYEYSTLRKVQRLGMVSIYDRSPEAPTWFYTGGDERNRAAQRDPLPPDVPHFLRHLLPPVKEISLPPEAWYPGLRLEIRGTMRHELEEAVANAERELDAARSGETLPSSEVLSRLEHAEAEFAKVRVAAGNSDRPGALSGRQSLLLDASGGRRIINRTLPDLPALPEGTLIRFQLLLLSPGHFNFQLARDIHKGLTAGYIGFVDGRIIAYRPGTFTEFETGRYPQTAGRSQLEILLELRPAADECRLTIRSPQEDLPLVDNVAVALNAWNPVGDSSKAITFDAHQGASAAIDNIEIRAPGDSDPLKSFDFEPPLHADDQEIVGIAGWTASSFCTGEGTSRVSSTALNGDLQEALRRLHAARRAVRDFQLPRLAAEARLAACRAECRSFDARIAAETARYGPDETIGLNDLRRLAARREREAGRLRAEAEVLAAEADLAAVEAGPSDDADRAEKLSAAQKRRGAAQEKLDEMSIADVTEPQAVSYTPLSRQYPRTSTGRRRALAEMIADRRNPLTARVAVNHVWMRHFHQPLVETVDNFGRSGALPTHPELLDWLAIEFMDSGWSLKHLHRLIVTSSAYRRSSARSADAVSMDPQNALLSRMNTGRMEAEVVRDSLLALGGMLDPAMGGQELENEQSLTTFRRSLYYASYPEKGGKSPLGELFDGADPTECYRRTRSILPQQALALTNSRLVRSVSESIAQRLSQNADKAADSSLEDHRMSGFATAAFETVLNRPAEDAEVDACCEYLETFPGDADAARQSLIRALLNHSDFLTIR